MNPYVHDRPRLQQLRLSPGLQAGPQRRSVDAIHHLLSGDTPAALEVLSDGLLFSLASSHESEITKSIAFVESLATTRGSMASAPGEGILRVGKALKESHVLHSSISVTAPVQPRSRSSNTGRGRGSGNSGGRQGFGGRGGGQQQQQSQGSATSPTTRP